MIGIVFVPARHACKERLVLAVLPGYVVATRARLARVRRWNSDKLPAVPLPVPQRCWLSLIKNAEHLSNKGSAFHFLPKIFTRKVKDPQSWRDAGLRVNQSISHHLCGTGSAVPSGFIFQLTTEFAPALVQNGFVQALLLRHFPARCLKRSRCRLRHVANLQVLDTYHRVVFADLCRGFVQKVVSGVRNAAVNPLDAAFRLFPVVAEFGLASHATLVLREALFVLLKTVERR